jgi:hypothetical protein
MHSPNKPKKFKQTLSARKLMATVFWARKRLLIVEFMQQGTITSQVSYFAPTNLLWRKGGGTSQTLIIQMLSPVLLWHPTATTNI